MASLRTIRRRITSVKNTQQITRAMKMVAAARMKKAQDNLYNARPYAEWLHEITASVVRRTDVELHPLLEKREVKRVALVVVSSDRGLCGGFNANICREAVRFLKEKEFEKSLILIGKKAQEFFKRREYKIRKEYKDVFTNFSYQRAREVGEDIISDYEKGEIDRVYIIYNYFVSVLSQDTTIDMFLPILSEKGPEQTEAEAESEEMVEEEKTEEIDFIYEPTRQEILKTLLPRSIHTYIYRVLLESLAGEYSARMTAMDAATENAAELIENLTLSYNKARQASITRELIEVVSGADAMKG
jgi:F-type H+-transporting ATPase subunit gamma